MKTIAERKSNGFWHMDFFTFKLCPFKISRKRHAQTHAARLINDFSPLLPLTWFPLGHNLFLVTQFVYIQELSHQRLPNSEHTLLPKLALFTPNYWNLKKEQLNIALPHTRTHTYTGKMLLLLLQHTFDWYSIRASTRPREYSLLTLPLLTAATERMRDDRARSQVDSFSAGENILFLSHWTNRNVLSARRQFVGVKNVERGRNLCCERANKKNWE